MDDNFTTTAGTDADEWICGKTPLKSAELLRRLSSSGPEIVVPLCIPPILLGIMAVLYIDEMIYFRRQKDLSWERRTSYAWVISFCCVLGLFIPAADKDLTLVLNFYFGICVKKFFELIVDYYGGKEKMVEHFGSTTVSPNPFPCCFVLCCCRNQPLTVPRLNKLQIVADQIIFVYTFVLFVRVVAEDDGLDRVLYGIILLLVLEIIGSASNLTTLYPFVLIGKASIGPLREYSFRGKYLSIQLVVACNTVQSFVLKIVKATSGLDCTFPYPSSNSPYLYHSYLLVCEMFFLSILAWFSFRRSEVGCKIWPCEENDTVAMESYGKSFEEKSSGNGSFTVKIYDESPPPPPPITEKQCYTNYVANDAL